jgi:hypothetical protein
MPKGETVTVYIDAESYRIIESAARRRKRTVGGFIAEAALKEAVGIEHAAAEAGDPTPHGDAEYVPDYFKACCEMARAGGTNGYRFAGYHLASELDRLRSSEMSQEEWAAKLSELQHLIWPSDLRTLEKGDYERIAEWFSERFPECMKLIPRRRSARFAEGVVELAEERDGIPGLPE